MRKSKRNTHPTLTPCEDLTKNFSVSLTVHLWGGEGCQNLFESVNLAKINVLLEHVTKRNQRLLLKSIRKGIQVHTCLGPFLKIIYPFLSKSPFYQLSKIVSFENVKRSIANGIWLDCENNSIIEIAIARISFTIAKYNGRIEGSSISSHWNNRKAKCLK